MDKEPIFDYIGFLFGNAIRGIIIIGLGSLLGEVGLFIAIAFFLWLLVQRFRLAKEEYYRELAKYRYDKYGKVAMETNLDFVAWLSRLHDEGKLDSVTDKCWFNEKKV